MRLVSVFRGKNGFPITLHFHYSPTFGGGFVQPVGELSDVGSAVVSDLSFSIGVVDIETEARTCIGGGPSPHRQITIRVPNNRAGATTEVTRDAGGELRFLSQVAHLPLTDLKRAHAGQTSCVRDLRSHGGDRAATFPRTLHPRC
jgi:hypothetical protein